MRDALIGRIGEDMWYTDDLTIQSIKKETNSYGSIEIEWQTVKVIKVDAQPMSKEKAEKDRQQALVLGGLIANSEAHLLKDAWQAVPPAMAESIRPLSDTLVATAEGHPELQDVFRECVR